MFTITNKNFSEKHENRNLAAPFKRANSDVTGRYRAADMAGY